MKEKWKNYQGYILIIILSLISVFFLPMLGSEIGLAFSFPNTAAGWTVYIVTKLCIVLINMLLFDQFVKQAKINIKDNANYLKAEEIFQLEQEQEEEILPPTAFFSKLYRNKGIKVAAMTALSVVGLASAALTFDWVSMLTYLFTIVGGLIYGLMTMAAVEEYWTNDYYKLALREEKKRTAAQIKQTEETQENDTN